MRAILHAIYAMLTASALPAADPSVTPQVQYGASYYSEYMPAALGPDRVKVDARLMRDAGFTVVRMGESSWGTFEPADGKFDFAWMDRVVSAFHEVGLKVILGTPTYSMPPWLAKAHPELYARPLGGGAVGYGMRQNMNYDDPTFRRYAERMIRALVAHYRDDPAVIGWQIDNETGANGAANDEVFGAFANQLQTKFGSPEALDDAWFLNYWGQAIHNWADLPRPDFTISPSYKLEWARFQQRRVTAYLAWQASLVRSLRRPSQFVIHDFASAMRTDVDEFAVAPLLDVVGINVYHAAQDNMDGDWQAMEGDYARSLKHRNYFVTETSAQTIGWNSSGEFPPYDGQIRLDAYANVASGANMLLYWHWASLHAGLESYWKGVLGHDLQPGRAYAEVARTGGELHRLGPAVANLHVPTQVAILYSADSSNALNFMPYRKEATGDWRPEQAAGYMSTLRQLHRAFYQADVAVDFLPDSATAADLARYRLLVIPSLYIATDATLRRVADYVKGGGHVLATFKSGVANENDAIRWEPLPGPLRAVAGLSYQEFTSLTRPVPLKGDPFGAGAGNQAVDWAEFLVPSTANVLASYDDPVIGRWPAVTRNAYGRGTFTYEGSAVSDRLQYGIVSAVLRDTDISSVLSSDPGTVRTRTAVDDRGRTVRFVMNFSSQDADFDYVHPDGVDLLSSRPIRRGERMLIPAWDLLIVRQN